MKLASVKSIEASVKRIETQVGQLAGTVGELAKQAKPGKLPSQPEQAQAITVLRGRKVLDNKVGEPRAMKEVEREGGASQQEEGEPEKRSEKAANPYEPPIPYPSRLRNEEKDNQFQELYKLALH